MLKTIFERYILKNFFDIELSSLEKEIAIESLEEKYKPAFRNSLILTLISLPAVILLDTSVLVNVLIPITMVSGSAWFAISLANIKKKFERFGLELTTDLFESFTASLFLLLALGTVALNFEFLTPLFEYRENTTIVAISSILGTIVIARIILKIFIGALKYDMNDAMLAGQAEIAEKFFKKSLSFLHQSASKLRDGNHLEIANYHIGNSFYEIFSHIKTNFKSRNLRNGKLEKLIKNAEYIKTNPGLSQDKIDHYSIELIENFLHYCGDDQQSKAAQKSLSNIANELNCIKNNNEAQALVDTRFAAIFEEIANLIETEGEALFNKVQPQEPNS